MSCRAGCPTQDHVSYSACFRDSGIRVAYTNSTAGWDYTKQKKWDQELSDYRSAIKQGIEPDGCDRRSIDRAVRKSDSDGVAYRAPGM